MSYTNGNMTDIFPKPSSGTIEILPKKPDFKKIARTLHIYAFIFYLDIPTYKIYYKVVAFDDQRRKHFKDTATKLKESCSKSKWNSWDDIHKRLKLSVEEDKKNADLRTCYKYNSNFYVVKSAFTTGQRTVPQGFQHVYQIHKSALKLYFVNKLNSLKITHKHKRFKAKDQYLFDVRTLEAYNNYAIPEGVTYVLVACENSFFAVHVVPADTFIPFLTKNPITFIPFPTKNPITEIKIAKTFTDPIYRQPVQTPYIEDAVIDGSEEEEMVQPKPDPVLLAWTSGEDLAESILMPPPAWTPAPHRSSAHPPSPAVAVSEIPVYHQIVYTIPGEKTINIVNLETVDWYQKTFKNVEWDDPKKIKIIGSWDPITEEPLNLTKNAMPSPEVSDENMPLQPTDNKFDYNLLPRIAGTEDAISSCETEDGMPCIEHCTEIVSMECSEDSTSTEQLASTTTFDLEESAGTTTAQVEAEILAAIASIEETSKHFDSSEDMNIDFDQLNFEMLETDDPEKWLNFYNL